MYFNIRRILISLLLSACVLSQPVAIYAAPSIATVQQSKKSKSSKSSKKSQKKSNNSKASSSKKPRTADEVKKAKQQNAKAQKETSKKMSLNVKETERRLNQLSQLEGEIRDCNDTIRTISAQLNKLNTSIKQATDSIDALNARLDAICAKYAASLHKSQGIKRQTSEMAFLFASESFSQAYRRSKSLKQFAKWQKKKSVEIKAIRAELDKRNEALTILRDRAQAELDILNAHKASLVSKQKQTGTLLDKLKRESSELKAIMKRQKSEASSLDAELDRIIAEEIKRQEKLKREQEEAARKAREEAERKAREEAERKAREEAEAKAREEAAAIANNEQKAQNDAKKAKAEAEKKQKEAEKQAAREKTKKGKPVSRKDKNKVKEPSPEPKPAQSKPDPVAETVAPPANVDFEQCKGQLPYPVKGKFTIVKRFGRQKHPTLEHVETNNSGIDIQTISGAEVYAIFDGEVSAVFRPDGYNTVVVIRHGKYMTVYANLGSLSVSSGQKVKAGQKIGSVFTDKNDNNRSVLHFEIRNQKAKENPELWLKR